MNVLILVLTLCVLYFFLLREMMMMIMMMMMMIINTNSGDSNILEKITAIIKDNGNDNSDDRDYDSSNDCTHTHHLFPL